MLERGIPKPQTPNPKPETNLGLKPEINHTISLVEHHVVALVQYCVDQARVKKDLLWGQKRHTMCGLLRDCLSTAALCSRSDAPAMLPAPVCVCVCVCVCVLIHI
jgi:hypothetical protein